MLDDRWIGDEHYVATVASQSWAYLQNKKRIGPANLHATLAAAHGVVARDDPRNDVIYLSPDSHTLAAGLTWSSNCAKLVGAAAAARMNLRSRLGHTATIDALITVSGYGNEFRNIYLMSGAGNAANLHGLEVTGDRNSFFNCHFAGPMHATEAGTAGYSCVELTGCEETYFKDCTFGTDTIGRSAANSVVRLGAAGTSRTIFEDCIFVAAAGAATPYFVENAAANNNYWTLFKRCLFINTGTALTLAMNIGTEGHKFIMDADCTFINCTDVAAAASEAAVRWCNVPASSLAAWDDTTVGLTVQYDHTA